MFQASLRHRPIGNRRIPLFQKLSSCWLKCYNNSNWAMDVLIFPSRYVLCLLRISRSSQGRSTIRRGHVESAPFPVLGASIFSLLIGFRSIEDGNHLCIQQSCMHPGLESGCPFQSFAFLLHLYTPRNPSLGGNRLATVP